MYLTLQEFLSRRGRNLQNNHKNRSEIEKTSHRGKIFLNQQNQSEKINHLSDIRIMQEMYR